MFDDEKDNLEYYVNHATIFSEADFLIFIENAEDERLWLFLFKEVLKNKKIAFNSYSQSGCEGKQYILKNYEPYINNYKGKACICIDSDFDYILENQQINSNKSVLQTYLYSVENYSCDGHILNELCDHDLLIDRGTFDFKEFFENYSTIIKELFLLDILLTKETTNINETYKNEIKVRLTQDNGVEYLKSLKNKVDAKIIEVKDKLVINEIKLGKIKSKIENDKLINQNNLHFYLNGHIMFKFTIELLEQIYNESLQCKINSLKDNFEGGRLSQKISELNNKKLNIKSLLIMTFKNYYRNGNSECLQKIIKDIKPIFFT